MAINPAKLEALMAAIAAEMEELPEGFKELMEKSLLKAGFGEQPAPVTLPAPVQVAVKVGHRTGYNLFYTARNKELREEGKDAGRQEQIVKEWHALGKDGQAPWNAQAAGSSAPAVKETGSKPMNGYNLFVKEMSPKLKDKFKGADLFRETARLWKEEDKEAWKAKAAALVAH